MSPPQPGVLPGNTIIITTPGLVTLGTEGDDVIYGSTGFDEIYGLGGNDVIFGDSGDDDIHGGTGGTAFAPTPVKSCSVTKISRSLCSGPPVSMCGGRG